jgi:hypothetical protein
MTAMIKNEITGKFEDRTIEVLVDAVMLCCGPDGWDLYAQSDFITQQVKGCEEAGEACKSVNKDRVENLKDDVGDMIVCVINMAVFDGSPFIDLWHGSQPFTVAPYGSALKKYQIRDIVHAMSKNLPDLHEILCLIKGLCHLYDLDPVDCLGIAYDVISERDGKMINGTFVKSTDLINSDI